MSTNVTQSEFSTERAEGFNRIPLARTVLADAETPLSAYAKLGQGPRSFLFESVGGASAGIVADSVPTSEWEETLSKARAMMRAISMCSGR